MRQAINNNPMVQVAVLGGLAVIVGLFFMMNMKGGSSSSSGSTASSAASTAPATGAPAAGATSSAGAPSAVTPGTGTSSTAPPTTSGSVSPSALVPGPGLPKPVIGAWKRGETVVLLIVRQGGIDDRLVRSSVRLLSSESGTAVFVTRANNVARYSRITQGVGVSQAPALVVVRPKRITGPTPEAQVDYGFRDAQGVVQAVHDAVYTGKDNLPYSPR